MALTQFTFGSVEGQFPSMFVAGAVCETETPSGSNAATTAAAHASQNVCRVATDTAVYVSFGSAPDASSDAVRFYLPANAVEYFRVRSGDKAAVVTP
jgi:hypothetical protein